VRDDAIVAPLDDPDRERHQLLLGGGQRTIGHGRAVEIAEASHLIGQQFVERPVPGTQFSSPSRSVVTVHRSSSRRTVLDAMTAEVPTIV